MVIDNLLHSNQHVAKVDGAHAGSLGDALRSLQTLFQLISDRARQLPDQVGLEHGRQGHGVGLTGNCCGAGGWHRQASSSEWSGQPRRRGRRGARGGGAGAAPAQPRRAGQRPALRQALSGMRLGYEVCVVRDTALP